MPAAGIPASIGNGTPGTEMATGVATAVNTVVTAPNRIRETAAAYERAFANKVLGRRSGYIALMGRLAGGVQVILLPEVAVALSDVLKRVCDDVQRGKRRSIIVVAEWIAPIDCPDPKPSSERAVADALEFAGAVETRLAILGHLQRGGSPSASDRARACRFAESAVTWRMGDVSRVYTDLSGRDIVSVPLAAIEEDCRNVDLDVLRLAQVIAH